MQYDVESYFEEHDEPVREIWRRWKRNRALFDETNGLGVGRDAELALRMLTDEAKRALEEADRDWMAAHCPRHGRVVRRWRKRRMDFLKAMDRENREYDGTLLFRHIDPNDEAQINKFLEIYRNEP